MRGQRSGRRSGQDSSWILVALSASSLRKGGMGWVPREVRLAVTASVGSHWYGGYVIDTGSSFAGGCVVAETLV